MDGSYRAEADCKSVGLVCKVGEVEEDLSAATGMFQFQSGVARRIWIRSRLRLDRRDEYEIVLNGDSRDHAGEICGYDLRRTVERSVVIKSTRRKSSPVDEK